MDAIQLYFKLAQAKLIGQMQYPISFITSIFGSFLASFIDVIALYLLFQRFRFIEGWVLEEICLLYGLLHMSFSVVEAVARGFDSFGRLIRTGHFDRILVRPQSIVLQILGAEFKSANIGRFIQGFIPFVIAVYALEITSLWQWLIIFLALFNAMLLFYSLLLIQATFSFWAHDSIEAMNAFTYGGLQMGQFPLSIYDTWFASFFTYVIPISITVYFPSLVILTKESDRYYSHAHLLTTLGPVIVVCFALLAYNFFLYGVRSYQSTGS